MLSATGGWHPYSLDARYSLRARPHSKKVASGLDRLASEHAAARRSLSSRASITRNRAIRSGGSASSRGSVDRCEYRGGFWPLGSRGLPPPSFNIVWVASRDRDTPGSNHASRISPRHDDGAGYASGATHRFSHPPPAEKHGLVIAIAAPAPPVHQRFPSAPSAFPAPVTAVETPPHRSQRSPRDSPQKQTAPRSPTPSTPPEAHSVHHQTPPPRSTPHPRAPRACR